LMAGKIWVESEGIPGKGSTFHFTVTASTASAIRSADTSNAGSESTADGEAAEDRNAAARNEVKPENVRVLLAEDNLINTKVALKMLAKLGYRADVVSNGFEVLAAVEKIPYDVILMDCQMPEMDGYEAAAQIRARETVENRKHIHIIAMTAYALKGDQEKCLAAGMDDYLSKPVREFELQKALQKYGKTDDFRASQAEPLADRTATLDDARQAVALDEPKAEAFSSATKEETAVERKSPPKIPESMRVFMPKPDAPPAHRAPAEFIDDVEDNLLDWETLWELEDASLNDLVQLTELFREQSKEQMALLHYAIDSRKAEEVNQIAHKLAGSCSACGLKAIVTPLRSLEGKGKEGKLEEFDQLLTEIEWLLKLSQSALDEYISALQRNTHS
jgi:CheY-like chemotaxis protein